MMVAFSHFSSVKLMAIVSKKDKLIEEAQKLALRGLFDKAAKVYEQILALEPSAINHRQKRAELLVKCGRNDDARKEFETIGANFAKNGFYLKAIAVFKQLQKLFPADISISVTLAELNEKLGLIANALSEYKLVYEFHEKAGNIPEALVILDRMQNVDPQNLPIKIKLAEAYVQNGKTNEGHAIFAKVAVLLLERGDNATLAKIAARAQQLFPNNPDFLLEVLAGQINQGNAGAAIDSLQGLLRSNPNKKRVWDLVAQAYLQLEQPQRVKIAYQHYLKYFPSEPTAILGLMTSIAAEKNLAGTLELLDEHEATLISGGFLQPLQQIYTSLDKIDPINSRVTEGLIRVATAAGNKIEIASLTSKLKSLHSVSGVSQSALTEPKQTPCFLDEQPLSTFETNASPFFGDSDFDKAAPDFGADDVDSTPIAAADTSPFDADFSDVITADEEIEDEEIEIDIDVDFDSQLDTLDLEAAPAQTADNWLDSVGDLFDSISTSPRGVKFGNEMDSSDAQSHFDLAQAFREMGLFDEAINEFRQASKDPSKRVECLIMQCACLRERGEVDKAITMLLTLLKPGLSSDNICAVKYELATCYEMAGDRDKANNLLNEIKATNPSFRDINSRLNAANLTDSLDFSDEDLQDF
jgi:tetratricopeptide (TPR) repeat protein